MAVRWMLVGTLAAAVVVVACAGPYGRMTEIVSQSVPGDSFRTLVVISGDDDQGALQLTARVRQQLNDAGVSALRRGGLWSIEREALADICPLGQPSEVDGLLFVYWNELDLYDCRTHKPAYQVRGGMQGTDLMVKRLLRYVRPKG
ncbi:MAG TPA: hypothetical protein VGQ25_00660 [Gemmatimonadales bacterium]|nr:hypothetical protein [Gemmatimonadales bacterium]